MNSFRNVVVTIFVALGVFAGALAIAGDATVSWQHPTQRVDNTTLPLSEIANTEIDWGACMATGVFPATPAGTKVVAAPTATTTITSLGYGWWCFRGRTVDTGGLRSDNSNVASKQFVAPPKPPVLSSIVTVAYELNTTPNGRVMLGRDVGRIKLGTPCEPNMWTTNRGDVYEVTLDHVELTRMPKSAVVVTQCEWRTV